MEQQCNDNQIGLKTIGELSGLNFFIPNYQRGYRWTRQQVKDLLNDINEFDASKDGFYCLQPLVVRLHNEKDIVTKIHETNKLSEIREILNKSVGKWEVIDGQQRLTTIYIILRCLDSDESYSLEYATRAKSREFLLNMDNDESENIDFYYMAQARKTVKEWLKPDFDKGAFLDKLKNKVNFIWYESVDEDPIKVFTRLNIGKIALTNSELIKALFLNRSNFAEKSTDSLRLRQQEIASEWDKIEYTLQSDEFWLFLHDKGYDRPTRIDFIFDLICSRNALNIEKLNKEDEKGKIIGSDEYRTFRYFYEYFKSTHQDGNNDEETQLQKTERAWQIVKSYFHTFSEWYDDLELYHYVGFLLAIDEPIPIEQRVDSWKAKKDKKEFVRYLKDEIKKAIGANGTDYQYKEDGSDKTICRSLLLFHNIQTVINQNHAQQSNDKYKIGTFYKFPFHLYKLEGWDVEHINSSTNNPEEDDDTRKEWLVNVYLSADEDTQKVINEYFDNEVKETKDGLFKKIKANFHDDLEVWTPEEKNRIWNYTLLDSSTNRSYGNAIFSAKRRVIIGKDQGRLIPIPKLLKDGKLAVDKESKFATSSFVPPCTKQVFLKYYSTTIGDNNYWTKADAEAYKNNIDLCLEKLDQNN